MQSTEHIFQSILAVAKVSGIMCISAKRVSSLAYTFGNAYLSASVILFTLNSVMISSVFWDFSQGGGSSCTVSVMMIYGIILALFYIIKGEQIFQNFQDLLEVKDLFCLTSEDLCLYEEVFEKQTKRINRFIKWYFLFNLSLTPLNALRPLLAYESEYLNQILSKNNPLLYPVYYFNVRSSPAIFWPTLIFETLILHMIIVLHTVNDLYILNITLSLILSFRYLRLKLKTILHSEPNKINVENPNLRFQLKLLEDPLVGLSTGISPNQNQTDCGTVEDKVKIWVQYHNHVLRLSREFARLYTPVMVSFFLFVFIVGSMGIFYITKGQAELFSMSEKVVIAVYFVGDVTLFMLICMAGTYLQVESEMVCQDAFHAPWYAHDRSIKSALMTISSVSRRPVRMTPMLSNTAELSLQTFVWVLNSMASFYIAFSRIQAIYNQKKLTE